MDTTTDGKRSVTLHDISLIKINTLIKDRLLRLLLFVRYRICECRGAGAGAA
jgi:hypothetical protein